MAETTHLREFANFDLPNPKANCPVGATPFAYFILVLSDDGEKHLQSITMTRYSATPENMTNKRKMFYEDAFFLFSGASDLLTKNIGGN